MMAFVRRSVQGTAWQGVLPHGELRHQLIVVGGPGAQGTWRIAHDVSTWLGLYAALTPCCKSVNGEKWSKCVAAATCVYGKRVPKLLSLLMLPMPLLFTSC